MKIHIVWILFLKCFWLLCLQCFPIIFFYDKIWEAKFASQILNWCEVSNFDNKYYYKHKQAWYLWKKQWTGLEVPLVIFFREGWKDSFRRMNKHQIWKSWVDHKKEFLCLWIFPLTFLITCWTCWMTPYACSSIYIHTYEFLIYFFPMILVYYYKHKRLLKRTLELHI